MKNIQIKAAQFFDLLKLKNVSMWEIFAQMIDGEEKKIIFLTEDEKVLFDYHLPKTIQELNKDKEKFTAEYASKLEQAEQRSKNN
ncbi:hypothetical protein [Riemerella columbipharyngis]|uniref:Uncharacterized protein n=1 Tax=Riemerella columbipharyngis TaxID=1071918 RepID=A0A1G7APJ2_9FLAO|nr:hypothetical protein [Riemerella columbipharyngis]SDE16712.1 hypothetical protein SAMN05421544_10447 [Riemerella columbipharyngis]